MGYREITRVLHAVECGHPGRQWVKKVEKVRLSVEPERRLVAVDEAKLKAHG